jgi:hypothetical protein
VSGFLPRSRLADTNFYACFSRGRIRLHADVIVNRIAKTLLAAQVSLRRLKLKRGRAGTESDLVHLCLVAQSRTRPSQIVRCHRWQTAAFRVCFHDCPDQLWSNAVSPDSACLIDGPQQWTCVDASSEAPTVDRLLHPCRNGNRPDMAAFPSQVSDHPVAFPKLKILET